MPVNASYSAARWEDYEEDSMLVYTTAGDDRVRESHEELEGITLPKSHAFWDTFYPPNGWNCRCSTFPTTTRRRTPDDQIPHGVIDNVPPMFRTNVAKEGLVFPEGHPYFSNKVKDFNINEKKDENLIPNKKPFKNLKTTKDLSNYFADFSKIEKEYFSKGFKFIRSTTNKDVNGYTYMDGRIYLKKNIINEINNGINNIHKNIPTTFSQEKAISTLHHEILHNANKVGYIRLTDIQTRYMELANEWVSRNRLPDFMKKLGGELQNRELITNRDNTGYNRMVKNYNSLLNRLECNMKESLKIVEKHLINERYDTQLEGLLKGLETSDKFTMTEASKRNIMIKALRESNENFNKILENEKLFIKKDL